MHRKKEKMKIYEITDLKELLENGNEAQIEKATVNIVKTVRMFVANSHSYLKEFGLNIVFEINNFISEPFKVKGNSNITLLVNPKHLVYKEDGTLNDFRDLEVPLTKTITELLMVVVDEKTLKDSSTLTKSTQKELYRKLFVFDGGYEIEPSLIKRFNQQTDHLKYHLLIELLDNVEFDDELEERFVKLDQLLDEGVFPMEAMVDFMEVCHRPRNNPLPVRNNIFRNKKTEDGFSQVEVDPILKVMENYALIQMVLNDTI